ncbi:tetratricopeptide repeat-containing glycosyltransferase family protein [Telmatospirillum sp.]|uniref:tetratricopeptide repeat-containing glycosyltransferase family protein n=1 Tax=Telmatospirillum sp. TaxID=2079197 RepID=UPI00284D468C|nr:tetratricopeptide repeat-containing glycosyltransferase family protein [Telmatospirillum sp.]MDR3435630.1 tetratricopeptide repeat-containing glycosyltransferase family protein [Telmatospirillum sp.]
MPNTMPDLKELFYEAVRHHQAGRLTEAENLYRRILLIDPFFADALHLLGVLANQVGRHDIAVDLINKAIALNDQVPTFHCNLGNVLRDMGKLDEAVSSYRRAIACKENYPEAHYNLGNALKDQGKLDEAAASYRRAVDQKPDLVAAHNNLALVLKAQGKLDDAVASYRQALACKPDLAEAHNNLANALKDKGDLKDAVASYRQALVYKPEFAEAHYNLGIALKDIGIELKDSNKLREAVASYQMALVYNPDYAEAHYNLGLLLLLIGRYEEGWHEYEWRWRVKDFLSPRRDFRQPLWQGECLKGKRILLHAEQGLGDAIQFCRYVPLVAALGGQVVLEVPRSLKGLLKGSGIDHIVAKGDPLPPFDLHCPLLSLPKVFGTRVETIPATIPYLTAGPERVAFWRDRLPQSGFRVGIVWHGNPTYGGNHNRSIPLTCFAPLASIPGVRLICLQKNHGLDQLESLPSGMHVERLGQDYDDGDFADTAAVIKNIDLVISSCTSVVHLAGALGQPVWLPLAAFPHWVWLLERDDSPWYPGMRLFRQTSHGDWPGVFKHIAAELKSHLPPLSIK